MASAHRTEDMIILRSPDLQLIVHAMPPHIASQVTIASPPLLRDSAAIKFFCTVESIPAAEESAHSSGGMVFAEQWHGPGFVVRNASDPEGNIFQVRQNAVTRTR